MQNKASTSNEVLGMTDCAVVVLMSESGVPQEVPGWVEVRVDDIYSNLAASMMDELLDDGLTDREAGRAIAQRTANRVAEIARSGTLTIVVVGDASRSWFAVEEFVDGLDGLHADVRVAIFARGEIGHGGIKMAGRSQGGRLRCVISAIV